jgi:hypothetical protein
VLNKPEDYEHDDDAPTVELEELKTDKTKEGAPNGSLKTDIDKISLDELMKEKEELFREFNAVVEQRSAKDTTAGEFSIYTQMLNDFADEILFLEEEIKKKQKKQ